MPQKIALPNGCTCSQLSVTPKNWKQLKKITGPWRISYRFYDPAQAKPKQINLKAMNAYSNLSERKVITQELIDAELKLLYAGHNPFLKKIVSPAADKYNLSQKTLFVDALCKALDRTALDPKTEKEIRNYIIPHVRTAAIHLGFDMMYISEVKRRQIIFILDHIKEISERFSDNTFNHYRKYLSILFEELLRIDAIEANVIKSIPKKDSATQPREVLTPSQRKFIDNYLKEKYPSFHRLLHIFFHSGARIKELCRLKVEDIDLENQQYRCVIKKGCKKRVVFRTIKNIALPYWAEAIKGGFPSDYVFSKGLVPGEHQIESKQITRRWYMNVKKKTFIIDGKETRITADFYSLKHPNTTEIVDRLDAEAAAALNEHTSTAMVVKIYDTKQSQRQKDRVKKVNNPFA